MSTDPVWQRDVVLTQLRRRDREGGEPVSRDTLVELCGVGPNDLEVTLGVLVEEGAVVTTPGDGEELYALHPDDPDANPPVASPDADDVLTEPPTEPGEPEAAREQPDEPPGGVALAQRERPTVALTRGMVDGLDAETVGKLVLAGLKDTGAGRFTMVIE